MMTYFIRHTKGIGIENETRERLWQERRIAIHFPYTAKAPAAAEDSTSLDPDDYAGAAKKCLRILLELAKDGGYVCAQHYPKEKWMLGMVRPNSKVELLKGKWIGGNRTAVLKSLTLSQVRLVDPLEYAVLAVGRPRMGTLMHWHRARKTVEDLVERRAGKVQLSDLAPSQQEILCSELLRLPEAGKLKLPRLAHLLLPTGRTMRDIDILGVATDGKKLVAQVTLSSSTDARWKLERLMAYRDSSQAHLVLFCQCEGPTQENGVTVFPIQQAYDVFTSTESGRTWLKGSAR
jgi:hypothetical protein